MGLTSIKSAFIPVPFPSSNDPLHPHLRPTITLFFSSEHLLGAFLLFEPTMYKLTLALFTFFSLVLPIFAFPRSVPEFDELKKRTTYTGTVRVIFSRPVHDADLLT
jgi:hypothetical protein